MFSPLEVFSDSSERLNYNLPTFPLYACKGTLQQFGRHTAPCHWHPDLEFILILEGAMDYFINGQTVCLGKGEGIFVNSKRMHYGFSSNKTDCTYIVIAIHPALLGENTLSGKAYLEEKFASAAEDFIMLTANNVWQKEALLLLPQIYDEMQNYKGNPLFLLSHAALLCACMGDHIKPNSEHSENEQAWMTIRRMTAYIHQHYDCKITIDDIAAAGTVCRSKCCDLFNKYAGQTPNNYLIRYRLQKSGEMLRETERSICEIAIACGFQTASYFSYVFRKDTGLTPQEFRKQSKMQISCK